MEPGRDALIFENNCEDQIYNEVLLFKKNLGKYIFAFSKTL